MTSIYSLCFHIFTIKYQGVTRFSHQLRFTAYAMFSISCSQLQIHQGNPAGAVTKPPIAFAFQRSSIFRTCCGFNFVVANTGVFYSVSMYVGWKISVVPDQKALRHTGIDFVSALRIGLDTFRIGHTNRTQLMARNVTLAFVYAIQYIISSLFARTSQISDQSFSRFTVHFQHHHPAHILSVSLFPK